MACDQNKHIEERMELSDVIDYAMRDWDNYIDECQEQEITPIFTFEEHIVDAVLNAGYRKQSEGHWYKHDKKKHGDTCYYCSVCEKMALADCMTWELTDYCPNCGARMKGDEGE